VANTTLQEPVVAGGFLTGADEVVQPYALPKYQHMQIQPNIGKPKIGKVAEAREHILGDDHSRSARMTLEVVGDEEDEDMEQVVLPVQEEDVGEGRIPKTMQELAEEAADAKNREVEKIAQNNRLADEGTIESSLKTARKEQVKEKTIGKTSTNKTTGRVTRLSAETMRPSPKPTHKLPPVQTTTQSRSRKRARDDDSEEEAEPSEGDDLAGDESELSALSEVEMTSRRSRRSPVNLPAPTASTTPAQTGGRTLRTRKAKTAEEVTAEREREAAYRRAIAR
jgi:xeroderma pigmentosum group C-complementing protein